MLTLLFILCGLIWAPILLHQIACRGFVVLIVWLAIVPVASNLINKPGRNPILKLPTVQKVQVASDSEPERNKYLTDPQDGSVEIRQLFEPTRILFSLFLVVFLLDWLRQAARACPLDGAEICMGLFFLISIVSVFTQSWRLHYGLRTVSDGFIFPFLAYYIARRLVINEERLRRVIQVLGYLAFALIIIALIERLLHMDPLHRVQGPFAHRDYLYTTLVSIFFMVLVHWHHLSDLWEGRAALPRGVRRFVIWLTPVIILLTLTRSNLLAFVMGGWLFIFLGRRLFNPERKIGAIGGVLLLLPAAAFAAIVLTPEAIVKDRIQDNVYVLSRIGAWQIMLEETADSRIFGIGLNNLLNLLGTKKVEVYEGVYNINSPHNSFLALFVELGIVGLLTYMASLAFIIRLGLNLYRKGRHPQDQWRGIAILAIVVAVWAPSLVSNFLYDFEVGKIYVFACIGSIAGVYSHRRIVPLQHLPARPARQTVS